MTSEYISNQNILKKVDSNNIEIAIGQPEEIFVFRDRAVFFVRNVEDSGVSQRPFIVYTSQIETIGPGVAKTVICLTSGRTVSLLGSANILEAVTSAFDAVNFPPVEGYDPTRQVPGMVFKRLDDNFFVASMMLMGSANLDDENASERPSANTV